MERRAEQSMNQFKATSGESMSVIRQIIKKTDRNAKDCVSDADNV